MFKLFKKRPGTIRLSLVELSSEGHCAVVGESHYQKALQDTSMTCSPGPEGRRTFTAVLVPEPDNPYDSNAVAVHSSVGKLGYLSRDDAEAYRDLFGEVSRLGYHGGACDAYITGGEPGKPSFGVVLQLANPSMCLAELRGEEDAEELDSEDDGEDRSGPGYRGGIHFTGYVEQVRQLRRDGRDREAEQLLLELVEATEAEARSEGRGVAPWYYQQLAILYRKRGEVGREVSILERFAGQSHAGGVMPPQLLERLGKARALLAKREIARQ